MTLVEISIVTRERDMGYDDNDFVIWLFYEYQSEKEQSQRAYRKERRGKVRYLEA